MHSLLDKLEEKRRKTRTDITYGRPGLLFRFYNFQLNCLCKTHARMLRLLTFLLDRSNEARSESQLSYLRPRMLITFSSFGSFPCARTAPKISRSSGLRRTISSKVQACVQLRANSSVSRTLSAAKWTSDCLTRAASFRTAKPALSDRPPMTCLPLYKTCSERRGLLYDCKILRKGILTSFLLFY